MASFGRDGRMVPPGGKEWSTWIATSLLLAASGYSIKVLLGVPEGPQRDLILVVIGALLAASASVFSLALRLELSARDNFGELLEAFLGEYVSNRLKLETDRRIMLDVTSGGHMVTLSLPAYKLATDSLRRYVQSSLVLQPEKSAKHGWLYSYDDFNFLTVEVAALTRTMMPIQNLGPPSLASVQQVSQRLGAIRTDLLNQPIPLARIEAA